MGKNDNRRSHKMRRLVRQRKKKARLARRVATAKANARPATPAPAAPKAAAPQKRAKKKAAESE